MTNTRYVLQPFNESRTIITINSSKYLITNYIILIYFLNIKSTSNLFLGSRKSIINFTDSNVGSSSISISSVLLCGDKMFNFFHLMTNRLKFMGFVVNFTRFHFIEFYCSYNPISLSGLEY